MPIAHINSTIASSSLLASGTPLPINKPAGALEGHFAIIFAHLDNDIGTLQTPTGGAAWNLGEITQYISGTDRTDGFWYKFLGPSEPATFNIQHNHGIDEQLSYICSVHSGVDPTTPLDVAHVAADVIDNAVPANPAITTVTDEAKVLIYHGMQANDVTAVLGPVSYTDLISQVSSPGNNNNGIALAEKIIPSFGTETPTVWRHTASPLDAADGALFTVALRPDTTETISHKPIRPGIERGLRIGAST